MSDHKEQQTELTVIGSGIAGLSAAFFAVQQGMETVLVGGAGSSDFASGPLDLLSAFPGEVITQWDDPWQALAALPDFFPQHPYTHMLPGEIDHALQQVLLALDRKGLGYQGLEHNVQLITGLGTHKRTYRVPETMWPAIQARQDKSACLFVDFHGLKDVSGPWLCSALSQAWPSIRTERIVFPDTEGRSELFPGLLAQSLESERVREQLAASVAPLLSSAEACLAFPAVLGLYSSRDIVAELEERLGLPVFEVPGLPPSIPGLRFQETMSAVLHEYACFQRETGKQVRQGRHQPASGGFVLDLDDGEQRSRVHSQKVILATGRFLGQGLQAGPEQVREAVFDLPVAAPGLDKGWHRKDFFDPRGHPVNRAGLEVEAGFRPLDHTGEVIFEGLHAAGSILAHSDWMRMKCGAGVAVASAFKAVQACV